VRIPPNFFGISFGLTGLSAAWNTARATLGVPAAVPAAIAILAVWLVLVIDYLAQGRARIAADLTHPVLAPFTGGAVIAPMILGAELAGVSATARRVVVVGFLAPTVVLGGGLTGQWMLGRLQPDAYHPGYFLPTAAGGLVGAYAAACGPPARRDRRRVRDRRPLLAAARLDRAQPAFLPAAAARPGADARHRAVAARGCRMASFGLDHGAVDIMACVFGSYAVLIAMVQLRFIPVYLRLPCTPGFWVFTFCYSAAVIDALAWIRHARPPGADGWAIAVLVLVTGFVGAIAIGTIVALIHGQFLRSPAQAATPSPVTTGAHP
jgi:tellurite resistance protein